MRPFVHVNIAIEGDGSTGTPTLCAKEISCVEDWRRVHGLRERYDAVAVGARTWRNDRPRLNVRPERLGREPRRQPHRIVFAGRQPCEVIDDGRPLFLVGTQPPEQQWVSFIRAEEHDIRSPLIGLYQSGIHSILVEGGATLVHSFLQQESVDWLTLFVRTLDPEVGLRAARHVIPELPWDLQVSPLGMGLLFSGGRRPPPPEDSETPPLPADKPDSSS